MKNQRMCVNHFIQGIFWLWVFAESFYKVICQPVWFFTGTKPVSNKVEPLVRLWEQDAALWLGDIVNR